MDSSCPIVHDNVIGEAAARLDWHDSKLESWDFPTQQLDFEIAVVDAIGSSAIALLQQCESVGFNTNYKSKRPPFLSSKLKFSCQSKASF